MYEKRLLMCMKRDYYCHVYEERLLLSCVSREITNVMCMKRDY